VRDRSGEDLPKKGADSREKRKRIRGLRGLLRRDHKNGIARGGKKKSNKGHGRTENFMRKRGNREGKTHAFHVFSGELKKGLSRAAKIRTFFITGHRKGQPGLGQSLGNDKGKNPGISLGGGVRSQEGSVGGAASGGTGLKKKAKAPNGVICQISRGEKQRFGSKKG